MYAGTETKITLHGIDMLKCLTVSPPMRTPDLHRSESGSCRTLSIFFLNLKGKSSRRTSNTRIYRKIIHMDYFAINTGVGVMMWLILQMDKMNVMAIARIVIVRQNHGRVKVRIWQSTGENIKNAESADT